MNRLKAFRAIERLNQEEAGSLLGVSAQLISAVESGRRRLTFPLEPTGYSDNRFELPSMSEPLHRQRAATKATNTKRAKELLRLAGEAHRELVDRTPRAPTVQVEALPNTPQTFDEIEEIAGEVRCILRHEETGPIKNLTSAIERAGVCIIPIVGLEGIDGISSWVEDVPVIGISPTVPGDRFRFTLAHEFGHLFFHKKKSSITEDQANRFAGALLMPETDMECLMPKTPTLRHFISLKTDWGLSVGASVYRAHELGYLDDARYRSIQIQMSKWRKTEPGYFKPQHGTLLTKLVETNGGTQHVARNLGLNEYHIAELTNWNHLRQISPPTARRLHALT